MSKSSLGGYMAFVLFMGAAFNDAFEWQRVAMRQQLSAHLEKMKSADPAEGKAAMAEALQTVQKIMGKDWSPTGDWGAQIEKLIGG